MKRIDGAWVQKLGDKLWVHMNGETFTYEPRKKTRRKGAGSANHEAGGITAPMPGKVTKIAVEVGQSVLVGQTLVVLEAMKMEYTLKATLAGQVSTLSCQIGDQVSLGQVLAKVEALKENDAKK